MSRMQTKGSHQALAPLETDRHATNLASHRVASPLPSAGSIITIPLSLATTQQYKMYQRLCFTTEKAIMAHAHTRSGDWGLYGRCNSGLHACIIINRNTSTSELTSTKDKETIPCPKCKHDMLKLSPKGAWWQCENCGNVLAEKFF